MAFLNDLPIADLIANYGYIAIFVVITLESAGVPCPGETVLISAAVYAGSTGNLNIGLVIAAAAAAAILGDNVGYWAGRRAGAGAARHSRCACTAASGSTRWPSGPPGWRRGTPGPGWSPLGRPGRGNGRGCGPG